MNRLERVVSVEEDPKLEGEFRHRVSIAGKPVGPYLNRTGAWFAARWLQLSVVAVRDAFLTFRIRSSLETAMGVKPNVRAVAKPIAPEPPSNPEIADDLPWWITVETTSGNPSISRRER